MGKDRYHYNAAGKYKGKTSDTGPGFDWSPIITLVVTLVLGGGVLYGLSQALTAVTQYCRENPWWAGGIAIVFMFAVAKIFGK